MPEFQLCGENYPTQQDHHAATKYLGSEHPEKYHSLSPKKRGPDNSGHWNVWYICPRNIQNLEG